ncbi:hypothetical protein ACF1BQ_009660 [Bradyrhizobium sp. RDT10]
MQAMTVILFPRKTSNLQWNVVRKLREHARTAIDADDETIVTISQRDCGDPLCGGARTIVLIMHPRRPTEAVKIDKPLEQITQIDLYDALAPLAAQSWPARTPSVG